MMNGGVRDVRYGMCLRTRECDYSSAKRSTPYVPLPNRLASSIQLFVERCRLGLNRPTLITKTE